MIPKLNMSKIGKENVHSDTFRMTAGGGSVRGGRTVQESGTPLSTTHNDVPRLHLDGPVSTPLRSRTAAGCGAAVRSASSTGTPLHSPHATPCYNLPSGNLTRRAAEVAGVVDINILQCSDVSLLQRKLIETAERLVQMEHWYETQLQERGSYYQHRLSSLTNHIAQAELWTAPDVVLNSKGRLPISSFSSATEYGSGAAFTTPLVADRTKPTNSHPRSTSASVRESTSANKLSHSRNHDTSESRAPSSGPFSVLLGNRNTITRKAAVNSGSAYLGIVSSTAGAHTTSDTTGSGAAVKGRRRSGSRTRKSSIFSSRAGASATSFDSNSKHDSLSQSSSDAFKNKSKKLNGSTSLGRCGNTTPQRARPSTGRTYTDHDALY